MKLRLASDLPVPPPITPEVRARVAREAREWGEEFRKKIRAMERLTPADRATVVR